MSGASWAITAGLGFGLFQSVNRRGVSGMNVYLATFVQLVASFVVLGGISLATEDLGVLLHVPLSAILNFAAAGFFHFFIGWTFLNASQKRIGAARTSPLIGTTPLFATVIAAMTLGEFPSFLAVLGIGLIVAGAYVISRWHGNSNGASPLTPPVETGWRASWLGLGAAFCWALSPIFIRAGLEELPSPLLGVTVGLAASAVGYGILLLFQPQYRATKNITGEAWFFKVLAGLLVGMSTWARWTALELAPIAVVLAITMISTPVVILISPYIVGKHIEQVTATLWSGAGLIIGGALMLTFIS
jgi:drug/metabolite transporter (DMT)-like permease